ncbi:DUF3267 domain-containing protein [Clostridium beijerinckii]|uniref:DUF3267 domain-containing protein n=1 Tax=Clostridium beijerinckii TaxID=1520 RepID=UPI000809CAF9|nr:DUF3267 domain-containing protein [Clostridium beijerinckii]OCA97844.1 hypothetical protein BGS1_02120 [Clostridium beijerinckii]
MSFKVSWKLHLECFFMDGVICVLDGNNIFNLFVDLLLNNEIINFTENRSIDLVIFLIIIFIPVIFVHEFVHEFIYGVFYKLFGGQIKFGLKGIYDYVEETSEIALQRTKFLIILLAPVIIISLISMFIQNIIGECILLLNLLGSTGDILMALYLCKYDSNSYIVDKSYGFDVINKENKNHTKR